MSYCTQICLHNGNGQQIEWGTLKTRFVEDHTPKVDVTWMPARLSFSTPEWILSAASWNIVSPFMLPRQGGDHAKVKHMLDARFMSILFLFWTIGDMSESKAKKIEIKDVDGRTLSKQIDYIYTAEIEVTEENVQVNSAPAKSSVYRTLRAHCFIASFHLTLATCSGSHGQ